MNHAPVSDDARQIGRPTKAMQLKPDIKATPRRGRLLIRKVFPDILQAVSNGSSLQDSLDRHGVAWTSFFRYLEKSHPARDAYARARQMRVEKWVDEMVPMSDAVVGKEMAIVTATRNAIDVRKWVASKLMPREYGDAPQSVTVNSQTNVMVMTDDKLAQLQAVRQRLIQQQKEA